MLLLAKELGGNRRTDLAGCRGARVAPTTSSLIHDDVVDESEERRGKASVRKVYDNKSGGITRRL